MFIHTWLGACEAPKSEPAAREAWTEGGETPRRERGMATNSLLALEVAREARRGAIHVPGGGCRLQAAQRAGKGGDRNSSSSKWSSK